MGLTSALFAVEERAAVCSAAVCSAVVKREAAAAAKAAVRMGSDAAVAALKRQDVMLDVNVLIEGEVRLGNHVVICLLYTSDAADE